MKRILVKTLLTVAFSLFSFLPMLYAQTEGEVTPSSEVEVPAEISHELLQLRLVVAQLKKQVATTNRKLTVSEIARTEEHSKVVEIEEKLTAVQGKVIALDTKLNEQGVTIATVKEDMAKNQELATARFTEVMLLISSIPLFWVLRNLKFSWVKNLATRFARRRPAKVSEIRAFRTDPVTRSLIVHSYEEVVAAGKHTAFEEFPIVYFREDGEKFHWTVKVEKGNGYLFRNTNDLGQDWITWKMISEQTGEILPVPRTSTPEQLADVFTTAST